MINKKLSSQVEMVSLEQLVPSGHNYRLFIESFDFSKVEGTLLSVDKKDPRGARGYQMDRLFRCLLLQFLEDLSDRELEKFLQENTAAKWFAGFSLQEKTPDYSLFSKTRKRIGTELLSKLFGIMRDQLRSKGLMNEVFNFVDASHLVSKANLWTERDKAIQAKYEALNNQSLPKVAIDKQARIGCKGGNQYWYGYKEHVCVDMQSGMINKIAITPANVTDAKGLRHVCPRQGAVYADKGYCVKPARKSLGKYNVHDATIKLTNMKVKDRDKDSWLCKVRSPYERVFSKRSPRVRYRGIERNQFWAFMRAFSFNLKRLITLPPPQPSAA